LKRVDGAAAKRDLGEMELRHAVEVASLPMIRNGLAAKTDETGEPQE
jgi:hypothetical protein